MSIGLEIQLIAVVVAIACALPGVFLVLRKMSLMSDAISHAILPGIVISFFIVQDLESPFLILGAVLMGLVTVSLTEALNRTNLIKEDAAIGMVFPVLFSIGVILVSKFAGNVHLDVDAVLLGELAFAPFDRFEIAGIDIASKSLVSMGIILVINLVVIILFYKELKLATFDPGLAAAIGLIPGVIHYGLMLMVSVTAVGAFDSVGSILVVALMIAPPAAAYLLTSRLSRMIIFSALIAAASAVSGYWIAIFLKDASIAGAMAGMSGFLFLLAFLFAPKRGIVAKYSMRMQQKWDFAIQMLLVHLLHHEGAKNANTECHKDHLTKHINWQKEFAIQVVQRATDQSYIGHQDGVLVLTSDGREYARSVMER